MNETNDKIILATDGSCLGNQSDINYGGYGGIIIINRKEYEFSGNLSNTTNNRMELLAVIEGLKLIEELNKSKLPITIYSDSQYVVKSINEWLEGWKSKNFRKIKNVDLWKRYVKVSENLSITLEWVKAHNGNTLNERADTLAFNSATSIIPDNEKEAYIKAEKDLEAKRKKADNLKAKKKLKKQIAEKKQLEIDEVNLLFSNEFNKDTPYY